MIYSDPGAPPPPSPAERAETAEYIKLLHRAQREGKNLALSLTQRATARFYDDPVFHARAVTAANVAQVEHAIRHPEQEPPVTELRLAAAVALIMAEDEMP